MTNRLLIVTMLFLLAFGSSELKAADWQKVVDLRGSWYFTVGDDPAWADPNTDISDWDRIDAPRAWEHYYEGYNGFAWYRHSFRLDPEVKGKDLTLFLGSIDDVDEVFVNGHKVGQTGYFPPYFKTAAGQDRRYIVPSEILLPTANVICVRVFDFYKQGGMVNANRFGFFIDRDLRFLDLDLSGKWKFSTDRYSDFNKTSFDDSLWDEIQVPAKWESQGCPDYDGYGWYRKKVIIPDYLLENKLFLILGRIDDYDKVYLNGHLIGRVEDLEAYSRFRRDNSCNLLRVYELPKEYVRNKNLIAVEVRDQWGDGGIYEGPIGIMTADNAEQLYKKNRWENRNSGWESFINDLLELLD
ncbi:sugar-binding domain-containing protein [Sunxiuqinia sp. A32]|uniref:sugar-binding domain-containing protein n=1 Tax=Sunxiuqinia sp. A32 TaxID=3461496 RepID=UPI004045C0E7